MRKHTNISVKELMSHITVDMYTRQTLVSLFRCFLETVIESRQNTIILVKIKDSKDFMGLLNRLKYSEATVYLYSDVDIDGFKKINLNGQLENDEFLLVMADRFSASLYWNESTSEVFGLTEGFCTLNPHDTKQVIDYVQSLVYSEELEKELAEVKQDRRHNERFTSILRKLAGSLESKQRDLICVNTELQELQEKSSEAEKMASIGQLSSMIAHEIRNPLGMIDLYAKIIAKNAEKITVDEAKQEVEALINASDVIRKTSSNLATLLNELLDFSKPSTLNKTENSVKSLVNEVITLLLPVYEEKNVSIKLLSEDDHVIHFDRLKLHQVVLNILKNALEASNENDCIELSQEFDLDLNQVIVKIKDQGSGIKLENLDKIFTPFFTTKKEGTGLGLAQSKKIMDAHGGSLTVASTGSCGTTFALTLPII